MDKFYEIRKMISKVTGVHPNDFGNKSRNREFILSRQLYASVLNEINEVPITERLELIGRSINRGRVNVYHMLQEVDNLCLTDKEYSRIHTEILEKSLRLINGDPEVIEESEDVKTLKHIIDELNNKILCLKNEVRSWRDEVDKVKAKYSRFNSLIC